VLLVALAAVPAGRADDASDARAIVDRAIKAVAGDADLAKLKAETWNEKGTYYGMGNGVPYTGKYAVQWPNQFRMEIEGFMTIVLNGDKGWIKDNNGTKEMTKEQLANHQEEQYSGWVASLLPLRDRAFRLAVSAQANIDSQPALAMRVSHKDHKDVVLYFDQKTGLLVKSSYRAKAEDQGGKEVEQEVYYKDYKDGDGIKVPMKVIIKRDGQQYVEAEMQDVKFPGKLDDSVFGKP
jgi:hypothetical protein